MDREKGRSGRKEDEVGDSDTRPDRQRLEAREPKRQKRVAGVRRLVSGSSWWVARRLLTGLTGGLSVQCAVGPPRPVLRAGSPAPLTLTLSLLSGRPGLRDRPLLRRLSRVRGRRPLPLPYLSKGTNVVVYAFVLSLSTL